MHVNELSVQHHIIVIVLKCLSTKLSSKVVKVSTLNKHLRQICRTAQKQVKIFFQPLLALKKTRDSLTFKSHPSSSPMSLHYLPIYISVIALSEPIISLFSLAPQSSSQIWAYPKKNPRHSYHVQKLFFPYFILFVSVSANSVSISELFVLHFTTCYILC